jgi:hypothetical protein
MSMTSFTLPTPRHGRPDLDAGDLLQAVLEVGAQFAALRLLPMSDRQKDVEVLVPRHQLTFLER